MRGRTGAALIGAKAGMPKFLSSIAARLIVTVLATGVLAFAMIGGLAILRLDLGLRDQADALGHLSARHLADRLDSEAQLARARIETIGSETSLRLRQIAQRADISKAIASRNDITILELLTAVAKTSDMQRLIAFDQDGIPIGMSNMVDLLAVNAEIQISDLASDIHSILRDNSRSHPNGHQSTRTMTPGLLKVLGLPSRLTIAHEAFEPVFDDFGDLIGALGGIRILGRTERTLENFSSLSNAGVAIIHGKEIISAAGPKASFSTMDRDSNGLIHSDDGSHVARCADYDASLKVCTYTDASIVTGTRDEMFRVGATETRSLMRQFLVVAAITLLMLVVGLLAGVRHATLGLSTLDAAARAVASGNIDQPFKPLGVGEVYSLGLAFEQMLQNLRASTGKIRQLAFYDGITGLPNREKFRLDSAEIIEESGRGALYFLDLDGFKSINDTFGHKTGDVLLRKVSERLTAFFSKTKYTTGQSKKDVTVARIGGDEFVMIIPGETDNQLLGKIAKDMLEYLCVPIEINGSHMSIGASIGITVYPLDGMSYEELLVNADLAMYASKERGRNKFSFFNSDISEKAKTRLALEQDLKIAVREKQLSVHYQPTISCKDGSIRGVEALARWQHPTLGNVPPERFIAIAEEIGLVHEIDRFVMQHAMREIGGLIDAGVDIALATNVSAAGIEDPFFVGEVAKLIDRAGFDPARLELEITESIAMRDPDAVCKSIAGLRQIGVRFAVDDFGAGYSNLATLARLPFDTVKLDRSLVDDLASDRDKQTIVRIGLTLASELGFDTVVEGIEKMEDFEFVSKAGATFAQGYLFSTPLSFEDLSVFLQTTLLGKIAAKARIEPDTKKPAFVLPTIRVANG